ncbi:MarR family transcriptional regulator [Paenibacillus sp. HB172176]|uniref:MarR family winged helix-turn-helix transcriptional regulator n=1 Tax=Paenibacillus sp. HB172176 TaxID=2493690 RepID=UPI00143AE51F|nr:MarR family transcriptional regulator [Paenibacillus sp. HB172176]
MPKQPAENIELQLAILIRRVTSATSSRKFGSLDRASYLLLHQISSHGSAGVKALAEEFRLDISTVSRQTAVLEQKKYVYRIPDPMDGRAYSLHITELGAELLAETRLARSRRIAELTQTWPSEEQQLFGELLEKFNRTFLSENSS